MKYKIGIDPDLRKSGVAIWDSEIKQFAEIKIMTLLELLQLLADYQDKAEVYLEAGWLNKKSNWHGKGQSIYVKQRIAKNVGENHATGKQIEQILIDLKMEYHLIIPKRRKATPEEFYKFTKISTKNQEKIDASMLVI